MEKCELCENPAMHLKAKCHITAPLRAEIENNILKLICYQCGKIVAKFHVSGGTIKTK